jgi:YbbR domain-containing protein
MSFWREVLTENWSLKLTAIFLAFVLWLVVRGDPGTERVITVPLEIRVPPNTVIVNERPNSVDVTVRGASSYVWFGQSTSPACVIDLEEAGEGEHIVPLTEANVRIARTAGIDVISVRPARISVVLEKTASKEVPIVAPIRGDPAEGFEIYGQSWSPNSILITGPRSRVAAIGQIATEGISVAGQRQPLRTFVNLNIPDSSIHTAKFSPVEVNIEIGPRRRLDVVTGVPVRAEEEGVLVEPGTVSVRVLTPLSRQQKLTAADFAATVSAIELDAGKEVAKVRPEVVLKTLDPATVIKDVQPALVTIRR